MTVNDQRFGPRKSRPIFGPVNVWFCDQCRAYGAIELSLTIRESVQSIRNAHEGKSPKCIGGTTWIRVVSLDELKTKGLVA